MYRNQPWVTDDDPSEAWRVFLPDLSFFDRKTSEVLGTHHLQATVNVVFKYLRQRSNGLKICLPAVFYIYVFSWFHSEIKTFMACGYRKYENVFTLGEYDTLG